jgi:hypothetical protein
MWLKFEKIIRGLQSTQSLRLYHAWTVGLCQFYYLCSKRKLHSPSQVVFCCRKPVSWGISSVWEPDHPSPHLITKTLNPFSPLQSLLISWPCVSPNIGFVISSGHKREGKRYNHSWAWDHKGEQSHRGCKGVPHSRVAGLPDELVMRLLVSSSRNASVNPQTVECKWVSAFSQST